MAPPGVACTASLSPHKGQEDHGDPHGTATETAPLLRNKERSDYVEHPDAKNDKAPCLPCRTSSWYLFDLAVLSVGIGTTFCAYNGAQQIITTLLPSIGSLSLGIVYSTFAISCAVAPAVVGALGLKPCIAIQLLLLSLWIASSLKPSVELAVPVALLLGFFAAPFWTAVPTYIATICNKYDAARHDEKKASALADLETALATATLPVDGPISAGGSSSASRLEEASVTLAPTTTMARLASTLTLVVSDPRLTLMVPLFLYQGAEQAFIFSVFGSRLVSPVFGDGMVGTISVGFGVTNVVSSVLLGRLTDSVGWPVPLGIGIFMQTAALCVLVAWKIFGLLVIENNDKGVAVMYAIAGAWGVGDGGFNTVVSTMLGNFFPPSARGTDTEAAFANMRMWASLFTGFCFFGMPPLHEHVSAHLAITIELLVTLGMILVATMALIVLHVWYSPDTQPRVAHKAAAVADPLSQEQRDDDEGGADRHNHTTTVTKARNTLGMFQGVFFGVFMSTHISGNALSGIILGSKQKHPPHQRVVDLFLVYTALGGTGFLIVLLLLRRHMAETPSTVSNPTESSEQTKQRNNALVN
eukprot:m.200574 g.200574  ORF g.200574 m.200574 type:complete len:585 (+) comp21102_c0_seq1:56-1810(+)